MAFHRMWRSIQTRIGLLDNWRFKVEHLTPSPPVTHATHVNVMELHSSLSLSVEITYLFVLTNKYV